MLRRGDGSEEGLGLVDRLLVFADGDRIGDDTAPGLDVRGAIGHEKRANGDAGIEIAREIEIEDCASIDAAASGLEFVDNFHGGFLARR